MTDNKKTPAFGILAGGSSRRMGTDKARLLLNGRTFLDILLDAGSFSPCRIVSLSAEADKEYAEALRCRGVLVVCDELADIGPLEGIRRILQAAEGPCLIVAADMPFLQADLLRLLAERYSGKGNLVLTCKDLPEPMCGIYGNECLPVIDELQKNGFRRPALLFDAVHTEYVAIEELGFADDMIRNINSPGEYRAACAEPGGLAVKENRYLNNEICRRLEKGSWTELPLSLVAECSLFLSVNGEAFPRIVCSPVNIKELVTGHLITEGIISDAVQIIDMSIDESAMPQIVAVAAEVKTNGEIREENGDCAFWNEAMIRKLADYVVRDAVKNRVSHSTHSCTLMRDGEVICCREDVGRHNAIARAVGWASDNEVDLGECIAFFSGRISADAVRKANAAGITVLCAKSLPTAEAVKLARETGMALLHCSDSRGVLWF